MPKRRIVKKLIKAGAKRKSKVSAATRKAIRARADKFTGIKDAERALKESNKWTRTQKVAAGVTAPVVGYASYKQHKKHQAKKRKRRRM